MTSNEIEKIARAATDEVEALCTPKMMTPAEAREFLEEVIANLKGSVDALNEELADDE